MELSFCLIIYLFLQKHPTTNKTTTTKTKGIMFILNSKENVAFTSIYNLCKQKHGTNFVYIVLDYEFLYLALTNKCWLTVRNNVFKYCKQ